MRNRVAETEWQLPDFGHFSGMQIRFFARAFLAGRPFGRAEDSW
jgi:hypothetical protein